MHSPGSPTRRSNAFTLIELLVVIFIIGILAAIALPVYNQFTIKSRQTTTLSNMRQVGMGFLLYSQDNNYQLPGRVTTGDKWPKLLQPYLQNLQVYNSPIPGYVGTQYQVTDPTQVISNSPNKTDYIMNGYNDIGGYTNSAITPRLNVMSTPTQVILLGIKLPTAGDFYMDFVEHNEVNALSTTPWPTGSAYVFCDGSSRFLKYPTNGNMSAAPTTSDTYSDWLWLMNKSNASP